MILIKSCDGIFVGSGVLGGFLKSVRKGKFLIPSVNSGGDVCLSEVLDFCQGDLFKIWVVLFMITEINSFSWHFFIFSDRVNFL